MTLRLTVLGPPSVEDEGGEVPTGLGPGKPLAILIYLALNGEVRRDALTALLWGDVPDDRARNAFRQALHRLRSALGSEILPHEPDTVRLAAGDMIRVDLREFDAALADGRYEEAIALYAGDFLEGFETGESGFDHWADAERARLRARYLGALEQAADRALDRGDGEAAVEWTRMLAEASELSAEAAVKHARALAAGGRRTEAIAWLEGFVDRFERDLGEPPPQDAADALVRLRQGDADGGGAPSGPTEAAPVERGPFVGREAELAWLAGMWREAKDGGAVALVEGEPGIGKSRLAEAFIGRVVVLDGALTLRSSGTLPRAHVPYAPVAAALRGALGARGLAGASAHLLAEAARLLPELRDRFDLPSAGPIEDEAARLRFFEGVAALLDAVAYEQPVCLILDDVDRADAASLDLVQFLASRLRGSSILFLLTCTAGTGCGEVADRLGVTGPMVTEAGSSSTTEPSDGAARMRLGGLTTAAIARLLDEDPVAAELTQDQRDRLADAADGNPLRALTLARRIAEGRPVASAPAALREILWARLESCDPRTRRVFLALALAGRPLSMDALAASTHLSQVAVLDAAERLAARGLTRDTEQGVLITHPLAAELALTRTGPAGLALLAGWTGDALRERGLAADAVLADLYDRAGRGRDAERHARRAGDSAAAAGAWDAARTAYTLAREHATDAGTRAEIAARLEALGAGRRRLHPGPGGEASTAKSDATGERPAGDGVASGPGEARWPRLTRRVVLGSAAIAAVVAGYLVAGPGAEPGPGVGTGHVLRDTLVLARSTPRGAEYLRITGPLSETPAGPWRAEQPFDGRPAWADSVEAPWVDPLPAPSGRHMAVHRQGPNGSRLFVISDEGRDTTDLLPDADDATALGWSPDGTWLLVGRSRRLPGGARDVDLYAVPVAVPGAAVSIDTAADRAVASAAWAPSGTRIAWTARIGPDGQRDVFISQADGTRARNVSRHGGEDYNIAWAPDGQRVAFTSERNGNADLYAAEVATGRLWRLTWDGAHDDRAAFSPDGAFTTFESTRGGVAAVYVMASWGGEPTRVSPAGQPVSHHGWLGDRIPYVSHFEIRPPHALRPGETALLEAAPIYTDYVPRHRGSVRWRALDPRILRIGPISAGRPVGGGQAETRVEGVSAGLGRVLVTAGGWRTDTALVKVGREPLLALADDFEDEGAPSDARWLVLGRPEPTVRDGVGAASSAGLVPQSDRAGESGVLSRASFPVEHGLDLRIWARAPFGASSGDDSRLVIALVMPHPPGTLDPQRPDFFRVASIRWIGEAERLAYGVGREVWTEAVDAALAETRAGDGGHRFEVRVDPSGRVAFLVDGRLRRRATLRLGGTGLPLHRLQLWLGGRGTGDRAAFDRVRVTVGSDDGTARVPTP